MIGNALKPSFFWIALIFGGLCLPLVVNKRSSNYSSDEAAYYLPAVRQIRAHWPALDLRRDSLSATAPGYPYLLATLSLVTGASALPLRLFTFALSLVLLWLLWRCFPRGQEWLAATALLALACSNFYIKSASWIVTDNPALLGMTGALLCLLLPSTLNQSGWAGCVSAVATFTRQSYAWLAVPVAWSAWRRPCSKSDWTGRLQFVMPLAPILVLGLLVAAWGGAVPPAWRQLSYPGASNLFAPLVYELAVLACVGGFFYAAVAGPDWRTDFSNRWIWLAAALGLAAAVVGPTSFSVSAGRWGGYLWLVAARLPAPAGRSLVFLILAPVGGAITGLLITRLRAETNATKFGLWACAFVMWSLSQLANRQIFHRYFEPPILVFLILWLLMILRSRAADSATRWLPLGLLVLGQLIITLAVVHYQVFSGHLLS